MRSHLQKRRLALATFACSVAALLVSASAAFAVQTNQYDVFRDTPACPYEGSFFNNPEFPEVACITSSAGSISLTIGKLTTAVTTPSRLGFAIVPGGVEPEVCPGIEICFHSVPGSTVADIDPIRINFPLSGKPPHFPPGHHKPWHAHGDPWHGHGGFFHRHRKLLHGFSAPSIKATVEPAGDVHAFTVSLDPTNSPPLFRLPLRIHLEGHLLGGNCYIGSSANPIEFAAYPIKEPEGNLLLDPNELPVFILELNGLNTADNTFAVPAAQGCGPAVGFGKHKHNLLDAEINAALGLPSPAGKNLLVLNESNSAFVISNSGGMTLKAAFDAAQQP